MSERVEEARKLLTKLKGRLVAGELDRAEFEAQRDLILADFSPAERASLGVTTATPVTVGGVSRTPATLGPLGPSGGVGSGVHTTLASLSDLQLEPGTVLLGQWRLERELGRGGFGAVFEAEETNLHERQAVKVLDPAMVAKEELLSRFRREVSVMRKLIHPRIVRVYDYREDLSQFIALISMQLVTGGSVRDLLAAAREKGEKVPVPLARAILTETLEALAEAHAQGVIHRDVTPGNVLLAGGTPEELLSNPGRDPQVKLVDFGIAGLVQRTELSQKSRVLGTAAYVAPEVLEPTAEITPAADVFGAGAIAYELLTGELPLGRYASPRELRMEVSEELDRFLLTLLARSPGARPAAAQALEGLRASGTKPVGAAAAAFPNTGVSRTLEQSPEFVQQTAQRLPPPPPWDPSAASRNEAPRPEPLERSPVPPPWVPPGARTEARSSTLVRRVAIGAGVAVIAAATLFFVSRSGDRKPAAAASVTAPAPAAEPPRTTATPAAPREDPAEVERHRAETAAREKAERERQARERVARYVDPLALEEGPPVALAVGSSGRVDDELSTTLARAIGGSQDLFRPAFVEDGLFLRAASGDRGILVDLGLGSYRGDILLVKEEVTLGSDSLARDLTVATVRLSGRLYRNSRGTTVQGSGKEGDFNRDRAISRSRATAVEELLAAVSAARGQ